MSTRFRVIALGLALLVTVSAPLLASESEWRWRIYESGNELDMYVLDSDDAATDDLGSLRFHCQKRSGWIKVESLMGPVERQIFADLIARGEEPSVKPAPADQDVSIGMAEPVFSELDGWIYSYVMAADEKTFDEFRATGTLRVRIGTRVVETTSKAGLDTVARFQAACRKG